MVLCSIRDNKSEGFSPPFPSMTPATAMREITLRLESDKMLRTFAEDFSLFNIGEFDPHTGRVLSYDPIHVCDIAHLTEVTDGPKSSAGLSEVG